MTHRKGAKRRGQTGIRETAGGGWNHAVRPLYYRPTRRVNPFVPDINSGGEGQNSSVVAQDCILLYRGFPIRRPSAKPGGVENPAPSRLEIGDTADLEICATKNFVLHPPPRHRGKGLKSSGAN